MTAKKAAEPPAPDPSTVTVSVPATPVQDGVGVVAERQDPGLDPDLEKLRDEEIERLAKVEITPRDEPTIDPALEAARDAEIKRQADAVAASGSKK